MNFQTRYYYVHFQFTVLGKVHTEIFPFSNVTQQVESRLFFRGRLY